ncbi:MAG: nucleotidyltransferase family protein [Alphaproteobacteria bacterium]|nr:nucleotidyltransferase family protein [Alphaproteobacteria bacterium]
MTGQQTGLQIILLAAGLSRRMGQENKLLLPYFGKPIVRHVVETIIQAKIGKLNIVTGFAADKVEEALAGLDVAFIHNSDFEQGQMGTVKVAYQNIGKPNDDVMIALADMPQITSLEYQQLVGAFEQQQKQKIIIPYFGDKRGNPIIMPAKFNAEIGNGSMNAGCRQLTKKRPADVCKFSVSSAAYIADIDTPEEYANVAANQYTFPICC